MDNWERLKPYNSLWKYTWIKNYAHSLGRNRYRWFKWLAFASAKRLAAIQTFSLIHYMRFGFQDLKVLE